MTPKTYIGIDPGMTGAIGVIWGTGGESVYDLNGSHADTVATLKEIAHTLSVERFPPGERVLVVIERVSAMPGQGVASMFKFGYSAGALEGAVLALGLPYRLVRPCVWKKGIPKGKTAARDAARAMFPAMSEDLRRVKDHGRAEALLLADWGRRHDK